MVFIYYTPIWKKWKAKNRRYNSQKQKESPGFVPILLKLSQNVNFSKIFFTAFLIYCMIIGNIN